MSAAVGGEPAAALGRRVPHVRRCAPRGVLVPGDRVRWRGGVYAIAALEGSLVHLAADADGCEGGVAVLLSVLAAARDFAVLDASGHALEQAELPDFALLEGISESASEEALAWHRAVVEVDTGLAPGAARGAVPRPAFDPAMTTLIERYQAKASEMRAVLGMKVSWQTVQAKRLRYRRHRSVVALVDGRRVKAVRAHGATDARVVELLLALVARQQRRHDPPSDARHLFGRLRRAVRAAYGEDVKVPAEPTLYKLLGRLGISARDLGALRTVRRPGQVGGPPFSVTEAQMPGELVQIDSTDLDLWVMGDDGRPARVELTLAVDIATRSIIAAVLRPKQTRRRSKDGRPQGPRVRGRATKAVDACELLAQALVPAPMRPEYDEAVHARLSDLPYEQLLAVDDRFAHAAARPVIIPDLVVIDHGTVFAGQVFFDACEYLGVSLRTARRRTGQDKAVVERTFGTVKSKFSQHVNTYTGRDPVRVRRTVDGEQLWTLAELDSMFQQWVALEWQNTAHPELVDPTGPREAYRPELTPNQMYAACVEVDGYLPIPLNHDDRLRILPTAWVGVSDQGIRFANRTYDNPERDPGRGLNPCRGTRSGLTGKRRKGRWEIRYTPNDPSRVWLRDHHRNMWVEAVWVHMHRVGAPFTQYLWDVAVSQYLERGGSMKDPDAELMIAEALAELLERAGRGPSTAKRRPGWTPDGYSPPASADPAREFAPYAGREPADRSMLPDPALLADPFAPDTPVHAQDAGAAGERTVPDGAAGAVPSDAALLDDPFALEDPGLGAGAADGDASPDWASHAVAPDATLLVWERTPQDGAQPEPQGESLADRHRRIRAALGLDASASGAAPHGAEDGPEKPEDGAGGSSRP
ncbi:MULTISPECIES: transposase [Streptomyces]|uniref:transposase n=1 Tax=Streptomyces TaxID=1883 RepID=UPI00240E13F6|nr:MULTISPECIES: transposase [Streptomyces]WFB83822.1 transposase [Streptomyces olivaceus]WGK50558.1 transposase [Streptomyces sp. B146]